MTRAPVVNSSVAEDATDSSVKAQQLPNGTQGAQNSTSLAVRPLSAGGKFEYGLREAFLNPGSYIGPAIGAYITQHRELRQPQKTSGDYFADGLSRLARNFATQSTAQVFGSGIYPIIFKQDPRYFQSRKRTFGARLLYAISRTVQTRGDDGEPQVNYSRLLGNLTSAGLANIYERSTPASIDAQGRVLEIHNRVGVGPTFRTYGYATASDAATYVFFDEFKVLNRLGKLFKRK